MKNFSTSSHSLILAALLVPAASYSLANETSSFSESVFYGETSLEAVREQNKQFDVAFSEMRFGVRGEVNTASLKILYDAEVDVFENANADEDSRALGKKARDLEVRTAKLTIPTQWGTLIAGKMNGRDAAADVYGGVDIFERNTMPLFTQPQTSARIVAYVTPVVAGGLYGAIAFQSLDDIDGNDLDAEALVVTYRKENWRISASHVRVVEGYGNLQSDYYRNALGANVSGDDWQLSAVFEQNKHHYLKSWDVLGVAGKKTFGSVDLSLGYAKRKFKGDEPATYAALSSTEDVAIVNVSKHLSENVKVWAEHGSYDVRQSNTSLGIQIKF